MTKNRKPKLIFGEGDPFDEVGINLLMVTQQSAKMTNAPMPIKKRWEIIDSWLGCGFEPFTSVQKQKIGKAWKAYMSLGVAPSKQLEPIFADTKNIANRSDLPPKEVLAVFHSLLATDLIEKKSPKQLSLTDKILGNRLKRSIAASLPFLIPLADMGLEGFLQLVERDIVRVIFTWLGFYLIVWLIYQVRKHWVDRSRLWKESKEFRHWVFGSLVWLVGVLIFVALLDPYNNGAWRYMDDDDWFHMIFVMFIPPIFSSSARYIYIKYIQ